MGTLFGIVMFLLSVCLIFKAITADCETLAETKEVYSTELSERIKYIGELNLQILELEEMITDTNLANSDNIKYFSVDWQSAAGQMRHADFPIGGDESTAETMRNLAVSRKEELTSLLFDEIERLPLRHRQNIVQNIEKTTCCNEGGEYENA